MFLWKQQPTKGETVRIEKGEIEKGGTAIFISLLYSDKSLFVPFN